MVVRYKMTTIVTLVFIAALVIPSPSLLSLIEFPISKSSSVESPSSFSTLIQSIASQFPKSLSISSFRSLLLPNNAYATGGIISDGPSCTAIGGTWDGISTCTVSSLTINSGETLIIASGISLKNIGTITNAGGIGNLGTITNSGTITNTYFIDNNAGATITNSGTINNNSGGTIRNYSGGTITNAGSIGNLGTIINDYGTITNTYFIDNNAGATITNSYGTINNNSGGTIRNYSGGTITNSYGTINNNSGGTITNSYGVITNSGTIYNNSGASINNSGGTINNTNTAGINNSGTINNNSGTINSIGTINNNSGGTINNNSGGTINNNSGGTINNNLDGTINNNSGAAISNSGTITNNSFSNIYNNSGGTINNNGIITVNSNVTIYNSGTINNNSGGTINNTGTIANSGTINNNFGATITNYFFIIDDIGSIMTNNGTITNNGTLREFCGVNFNGSGTLSGNLIQNLCKPNTVLTMSANATTVVQGQYINFTYFEKNTGNVPLTSPSVSDNSCSPLTSHLNVAGFNEGDTIENNILDPGETWVFQCIEKQTTSGTIIHTATGSGTDPSSNVITAPAYPSEQTSLLVTVAPHSPPPPGTSSSLSVQSATNAGSVTLSTNAGGFSSLTSIAQTALTVPPPAGSYPFGFFNFLISGLVPGETATITMTYPSSSLGTVYEKQYGSFWCNLQPPIATVSGNVVTLTLTDGTICQDSDQTINGQITDPGGILASTSGRVTGGGHIGSGTDFGFDVSSDGDAKHTTKGNLEYHDKSANIILHSNSVSFLSVNPSTTGATFVGKGELDKHKGDVTVLASVTDSDKTGEHDTLSITITDSSGKVLYQNTGTVKGHIEIHKSADHDDKSDSGIQHGISNKDHNSH